jgi:hypothetical protein
MGDNFQMTSALSIGFVSVLFIGLLFLALNNPLEKAIQRTLKAENLDPLLEHLGRGNEPALPNMYHRAINRLWTSHERELAAGLVKVLAVTHPSAKISQYWLNQAITIEPAIARDNFSDDFLAQYFNPKVASQCGPAG